MVKGFVTKRLITWPVTKRSSVKMLITESNHNIDIKYNGCVMSMENTV